MYSGRAETARVIGTTAIAAVATPKMERANGRLTLASKRHLGTTA
jgi:hypothetical protein